MRGTIHYSIIQFKVCLPAEDAEDEVEHEEGPDDDEGHEVDHVEGVAHRVVELKDARTL